MDIKELRDKSPQDLEQMIKDLHKEQFNLRVQKALQQPVKTHLFKQARRSIARIKTILGERNT